MASDLTTAGNATTALQTRWCEPPLTTSLVAVLEERRDWTDEDRLPQLSEEDRSCAEQALAVYDAKPRGTPPSDIAKLVGATATAYPAHRASDAEAISRLKLYQAKLADIDLDRLQGAFSEAVCTIKFFPSIAELRELAAKLPAPPWMVRAFRLRQLLRAQREQAEPAEMITAEQMRDLRLRLAGGGVALPAPAPRAKAAAATVADYIALGLSEQDARQAVEDRTRLLSRTTAKPIGDVAVAA